MWKIGTILKTKTNNNFSISRRSELCLIGRDGNKHFLKYHECIDKFGNQLSPEDIDKAYLKMKDPMKKNASAILLL